MINQFFPSKIVIEGHEHEFDLSADVRVNTADLNTEFCKQAELFARYSTGYELSLCETNKLELHIDRLRAQLDYQGRMEATSAGIKFTEKMAEHYVNGHADFLVASEELLQAKKITGLLKQAKDAIVQKKDMLQQLGPIQREERRADISMKIEALKQS
jgi:hypothetical protein